ncbi:hypothetical protein GCM10010149_84550 [Nonomuraea roseoviolacea subsp. roseoviolacea]
MTRPDKRGHGGPSDLAPGLYVPDTVARPHRHLTGFPLDNREIHRNVSFPPVRVNGPTSHGRGQHGGWGFGMAVRTYRGDSG